MTTLVTALLRRSAALWIARISLTFPFWTSGLTKLIDFPGGVAEMAHVGLEPAVAFNIATVAVQFGGSALIVAGRHVWLGAAALAAFTALTIPLVHHFWSLSEEPFRTIALHTATEHVGLIGGLLGIAVLSARMPRAEPGRG